MKLYFSPGACSLAAHISLREAGVPFELVKTDLRAKKTADGRDFLKINPKGYVPALELDDGAMLSENVAVLKYIGDRNPAARLVPASGSMERYRLDEWLAFINSEVHKSFSPFFSPATPEAYKETLRDKLSQRLNYVQGVLDTRDFLTGSQFAVPDAYLFTVLRWAPSANLDLARWPAVKRYSDRIGQRPQVMAALKAEGLA